MRRCKTNGSKEYGGVLFLFFNEMLNKKYKLSSNYIVKKIFLTILICMT